MCLECDPLRTELERVKATYAQENGQLMEEVSGLMRTTRKLSAENAALARELTKMHGDSPKAEEIRAIGEAWLRTHPKAKLPVGGRRWKVIEKALKDHEAGELLEALEGIRLFPFMVRAQRVPEFVPGAKRYDDVEHALGDEVRIGKARLLAQWARADKAERCWLRYQWATMTAEMWLGLCMEGLEERRRFSVAEMVNGHGNGSGEGS